MAIYKVINESAPEPEDYLKEACDYLQGCLEGSYEIDEDLLDECVDIVNETTREMKEFRKKWGNQKGSRAADSFSDEMKREINDRNLYYSVRNGQIARGKAKLYGDEDGEYKHERNLNRLRANVQAKDYLKSGGSKEDLKKNIADAKHSANRELTERIAGMIRRSRRKKKD